jgi:hypothetical protein
MTEAESSTVLIGVFPDRAGAEAFVRALHAAGFGEDQVGVATPGEAAPSAVAEEGALAGALTGGTLGALTGAAAVAGLIPVAGPVLAGGMLTALLAGTAVGATAGGLLGALISLGVPAEQARQYERELHAGRTLVVVKAPGRYAEALALLRRCQQGAAAPEPAPAARLEVEQLDELL